MHYDDLILELAAIERAAIKRLRERDARLQLGEAWSNDNEDHPIAPSNGAEFRDAA